MLLSHMQVVFSMVSVEASSTMPLLQLAMALRTASSTGSSETHGVLDGVKQATSEFSLVATAVSTKMSIHLSFDDFIDLT